MSARGDAATRRRTAVAANAARVCALNVEQASYAYAARRRAAPIFTLEATQLSGAASANWSPFSVPTPAENPRCCALIAGAIAPLSGRVELDGFETSRLDPRTRAQRIALVQQESPLLFPPARVGLCVAGAPPSRAALWFENEEDCLHRRKCAGAGRRRASSRSLDGPSFPAAKSSA